MPTVTPALVKELRNLTNAPMMACKKALDESGGDVEQAKDVLRKKGELTAGRKATRATNEGKIIVKLSADGASAVMLKLSCETDFVARNEKFSALLDSLADLALTNEFDDFKRLKVPAGDKTVRETVNLFIAEVGENLSLEEPLVLKAEKRQFFASYTHTNGKIATLLVLEGAGKEKPAIRALGNDLSMHVAATEVYSLSEKDLDPAMLQKERDFLVEEAIKSGKPKEIAEKMVAGRLNKFKSEVCLIDQAFVKDPSTKVKELIDQVNREAGTSVELVAFHKATV